MGWLKPTPRSPFSILPPSGNRPKGSVVVGCQVVNKGFDPPTNNAVISEGVLGRFLLQGCGVGGFLHGEGLLGCLWKTWFWWETPTEKSILGKVGRWKHGDFMVSIMGSDFMVSNKQNQPTWYFSYGGCFLSGKIFQDLFSALRIRSTPPDRINFWGVPMISERRRISSFKYNPFRKGHTHGFLGMICLRDWCFFVESMMALDNHKIRHIPMWCRGLMRTHELPIYIVFPCNVFLSFQ